MTLFGVILYGPPAAGKSTVTQELVSLDPRFELFRRLKSGGGRVDEYCMVSREEIEQVRQHEVVWRNERYDSIYVIDRSRLVSMMSSKIPVIHLGQTEAVSAVATFVPGRWLTVDLWCPRQVAIARITARATGDTAARVKAWDETVPLPDADLMLDTSRASATQVARDIVDALKVFAVDAPRKAS